jgi:glycosyltransferase involved in cell wall biosynthesis
MEKLLVEIARHSDRSRFDLRFVCLGERDALAEDIEACGWPVTALRKPPGIRPRLVWQLARLFARWKPDVVHTHNTPPLLYCTPAARAVGVASVVHTRHGQSYRAGRRQTAAFRLASLLADRVVCVSEDSARLSAQEGVARHKIRRLWNGIDLARFSYCGPDAGGPVVMVARLSPEKDAETLVRAAALAVRQFPAFRLEIAGDGACAPALAQLIADLQLGEQVRLLGEVRDVPSLLRRASLFVLPSLSEGISLTVLEAMASGLPVVATRVGGTPEVVVDGQTGFLVAPSSPPDLARKMVQVLQQPQLGREMGKAGRQRVEQHFSIRGMLDEYQRLYREVVRKVSR